MRDSTHRKLKDRRAKRYAQKSRAETRAYEGDQLRDAYELVWDLSGASLERQIADVTRAARLADAAGHREIGSKLYSAVKALNKAYSQQKAGHEMMRQALSQMKGALSSPAQGRGYGGQRRRR